MPFPPITRWVKPFITFGKEVCTPLMQLVSEVASKKKIDEAIQNQSQKALCQEALLPKASPEIAEWISCGLVRDLTEEVGETVVNKEITDLFKRSQMHSSIIPFHENDPQAAEESLMALAHEMKYGARDEDEIAKRVCMIEPSLSKEAGKFLREKIAAIYGKQVLFIEFNGSKHSLNLAGKTSFSLNEKLKGKIFPSTHDVKELEETVKELMPAPTQEQILSRLMSKLVGGAPEENEGGDWIERLSKLAEDFTAKAEAGKIDPVYERDEEIERAFKALAGKNLSSVVLYGPPGCGKTKIAEGIALKIASGDVPEFMKKRRVFFVSNLNTVAGTRYRGDLEEKVKKIVEIATQHAGEVLIVWDEIFQTVQANAADTPSIADLLKSTIDRPVFPLLVMTTAEEYQSLVKKNSAFGRRLKPQEIKRFSPLKALEVFKKDRERLEREKEISIDDSAFGAAVYLSLKYIENEGLPSAAYKLLDDVAGDTITAETVIRHVADTHNMNEEDVAAELERLKADPLVDLIDKSSLLHRFGDKMVPVPGERQLLKGLSSRYKVVFVEGAPFSGKTTAIGQTLHHLHGHKVGVKLRLHDLYSDRKIDPTALAREIAPLADKLVLVLEGSDLNFQFGSLFLKSIQPLIEQGKLSMIVEMHEEEKIPTFWKNRSKVINLTAAKPEPEPLFWRIVSPLTSLFTGIKNRIGQIWSHTFARSRKG